MSQPYLGEIRMVGFNFPPRNWVKCDGQNLPIEQYQALFSLLGTAYGGDGRSTFALPDLRGRTPLHISSSISLGTHDGDETVTLGTDNLPSHTHTLRAHDQSATTGTPGNTTVVAQSIFHTDVTTNLVDFASEALASTGTGDGYNKMQPTSVINFIICTTGGTFPPRN